MNQDIAQQNLALLQIHHPNVAKNLLDFLQRQREEKRPPVYCIEQKESGAPVLLKIGRQTPIHLPDNHSPDTQTQPGTILIRSCGLGYLPCAFAPMLHRIKLAIIEPDYEILFCALQTTDWRTLLPSPNLLLLIGERAVQQAVDLIETHASMLKDGYTILPGRTLLASEQAEFDRLEALVAQSRERFGSLPCTISEPIPNRIAIAAAEPHRDLLPVLSDEAGAVKLDAYTVFRPAAIKRWLQTDEMGGETLGTPLPSSILTFSQNVFHPFEWMQFKERGIERIAWCFDDPFRSIRNDEFYACLDRIFCFDPYLTKRLSRESPIPVDYLPAAASFDEEQQGQAPLGVPDTIELSFVGSTGLQRFDDRLLHWIGEKNQSFQTLKTFIDGYLQKGENIPYEELLSLNGPIPGAEGLSRIRILEDIATFLVRLHYLSVLLDTPARIYGDRGWSISALTGEISRLYQGKPLDYTCETPWVYRHSRINLNTFNVQCVDSPTVRIFDVMACGGFMLTEYRPFLESIFKIGEEIEVFRTRRELRDKVDYYLSHPEERAKIARAGQICVLKGHRYRHRLQELFNNIIEK